MGEPTLQRGKVVAYTQASQPRTQTSTRTHIKIMQTKKARISRQRTMASTKISTCWLDLPVLRYQLLFLLLLLLQRGNWTRTPVGRVWRRLKGREKNKNNNNKNPPLCVCVWWRVQGLKCIELSIIWIQNSSMPEISHGAWEVKPQCVFVYVVWLRNEWQRERKKCHNSIKW